MARKRKRTEYELKKLSDFWLDLAKIALASLVVKLFEPEITVTLGSLVFASAGLIMFLVCAKTGLGFAKKVEKE